MNRYLVMGLLGALVSSQNLAAKPWKSGEIVSQESFRYGAFEARMKASRGDAGISSFTLLAEGSWVPGREWQEMDFEFLGKNGGKMYQTQIITPGDPRTQHIKEHRYGESLSDGFHSYRMEWTPDELRFYYDGQMVRKETDRSEYGKFLDAGRVEDMKLRFSLWAGFSNWSGSLNPQQLPTPFVIDWVKVYRYNKPDASFSLLWEDGFDSFDSRRWSKADWTFEYALNDFKPSQVATGDGFVTIYFSAE